MKHPILVNAPFLPRRYSRAIFSLPLIALLLLLVACGDEPTRVTTFATPTPQPPAPIVDTPLPIAPTATAVTLGQPPTTPTPSPVPPTATPNQTTVQNTYVRDATAILARVVTAPEITDAINASGEAVANALFGTVDVNALLDKLDKAAGVVSQAGEDFAKLTPPEEYKSTHDRLIATFQLYDTGFSKAETAVNSGDWFSLASAIDDIVTATDQLNTLSKELGGPGY